MFLDHGTVSRKIANTTNKLNSTFYRCDTINIDGTPKDPGEYRRTYTYAMKMRSAMTYGFGRSYERGRTHWTQTEGISWTGNPSISTIVSRYMVALRKRKVC